MIVRARPLALRAAIAAAVCAFIGACSAGNESLKPAEFSTAVPKQPPSGSEERLALADLVSVSTEGSAVASDAARQQLLEPDRTGYDQIGMASWYGAQFHGRETADGEISIMRNSPPRTVAPMPSYVRVTNIEERPFIVLRVNDRGPYSRPPDRRPSRRRRSCLRRNSSTKVRAVSHGAAQLRRAWPCCTPPIAARACPCPMLGFRSRSSRRSLLRRRPCA
jgi:hypothetical protein